MNAADSTWRWNLQSFSSVQRAGQRLMVGFEGLQFNDTLKHYIDDLKVGGLILFAQNLKSPDQIADLCQAAQSFAHQCGQPPLLIGIDQEGGVVARLKPPFTQFDGNPGMKTIRDAEQFAQITATELKSIGINMDMAPVLDVLPAHGPSVMQSRSFGHDPRWVTQMGITVIDGLQKHGIMAVAKHFPGIGRTIIDSHEDLPDSDITLDDLESIDLLPFREAVKSQVAGIMLSHIRYQHFDPQWPASLSSLIAGDYLRRKMGFTGLVLTDDFDMGAIAKHYEIPTIVAQSLQADIDILLICHQGPKIEDAFNEIVTRCEASEQLAQMESLSLERIFRAKKKYLAA
jgi:beta-N-acetylhexosaminidase